MTLLGTALVVWACGGDHEATAPKGAAAASSVAARIDEREVSVDEVDAWIRNDLFERATRGNDPLRLYELRRRAVEEMAAEAAVAKAGGSPEEVLRREEQKRAQVSDEEVRAYYEANKPRFRGLPFEKAAAAARLQLTTQRQVEAKEAYAAELREAVKLEILLEPPRFEIPARHPPRGERDAPVTLTEFGGYACPLCKAAAPSVSAVLARYAKQVNYQFLHFPRDSRPEGWLAAEAAECAGEQGRFWELHGAIAGQPQAPAREALRTIAQQLGLDPAKFDACLASGRARDAVQRDVAVAGSVGVSATPAFFVNGVPFTGHRTVEGLAEAIDDELERKRAAVAP